MKQIFKLLFLIIPFSVISQNVSNSPYSRFGFGELQSSYSAIHSAMGEVGVAINSPVGINTINPASYAFVHKQRFTMQAGLSHQTNLMEAGGVSQVVNTSKFNYLKMGFPVNRWWGSSFGLLPFSETAYSFNDSNTDPDATYSFNGNGGLSRFYFGNGFRPIKNLSIGVNINYLFGSIETNREVMFSDPSFLNAKANEETIINGLHYDFGLLYTQPIKDWRLNLGITYNNASSLSAERNLFTQTFRVVNFNQVLEDTIQFLQLEEGELVLPTSLGYGFSLVNDKWTIAAEYKTKNWSEFELFGVNDNLQNSSKLSVGAEFIPEIKAINKYHKIVRYRLGFYNAQTYLNLNNQSIDQYALTFGLGLPLRRSGALLNLSAQVGRRGTTDYNLIQDSFVNFKIGFVLSDIWFIKRKFD
jgi:hypothetical protein